MGGGRTTMKNNDTVSHPPTQTYPKDITGSHRYFLPSSHRAGGKVAVKTKDAPPESPPSRLISPMTPSLPCLSARTWHEYHMSRERERRSHSPIEQDSRPEKKTTPAGMNALICICACVCGVTRMHPREWGGSMGPVPLSGREYRGGPSEARDG